MCSANDISKEHKRSKVNAADVHQALCEVGFEKYSSELHEFMRNYDQSKEDNKLSNLGVKRNIDANKDTQINSKRLKYEGEDGEGEEMDE